MRFTEIITEGRGIAAREIGTQFQDGNGDTITLQQIIYLPSDPGQYPENEVLMNAIQEFADQFEGDTYMTGNPTAGSKAAMITVWKHAGGDLEAYGKYASKINPGLLGVNWTNADFNRAVGYGPQDKKSITQTLDVKPGDVLGGKQIAINRVPAALTSGLESRDVDATLKTEMATLVQQAGNGDTALVPGANENANLHEVYTGEYAAPYALAKNSSLLIGDMQAVEDQLLKPQGLSWKSFTKVIWPTSIAEKLVDSYLIAGDYKLGVSSKAQTGGGAAASVDGIMGIISRKKDQMDPKFLKKNAKFIKALEVIMSKNSSDGPLTLAVTWNFITADIANEIKERSKSFDNNVGTLSKPAQKLLKHGAKSPVSGKVYSPNLSHANYNIGFHMMSIVSRLVGAKLNSMDATGFFKGVLNYADLVQVYTKVKKGGDAAAFSAFKVVYPPTFAGTIQVDPETNYYASAKPKGRITFKLRK